MRLTTALVTLLAVTSFSLPVFAQSEEDVLNQIESLHGKSAEFGEAYGALQDSFLFEDPAAFAALGYYPFDIEANGELYEIQTAEDLVDNFDALLTDETIAALSGQDFADLIVNSDGVGFANGALWMSLVCADESCNESNWGIIRISN